MPQASNVLSHIEVVYRPGERDLAIALFEAMGCKTYETDTKNPAGVSYISAHPDPDVRGQDDVFYISEMPPVQAALEGLLRQRIETDDAEPMTGVRLGKTIGSPVVLMRTQAFVSNAMGSP